MRNPASHHVRTTPRALVRAARVSAGAATTTLALVASMSLLFAGTASAETSSGTSSAALGLLGPVGLGAVVVGVIGMAAGVARSRKKAAATSSGGPVPPPAAAPGAVPTPRGEGGRDLADEPTKVLSPVRPSVR